MLDTRQIEPTNESSYRAGDDELCMYGILAHPSHSTHLPVTTNYVWHPRTPPTQLIYLVS